ncbi:MAG: 50S ribosomal protein L30 [Alphaproteobacteria bacterium]|tara:strand:+ start:687 stop:869 length:183 start_codon:yes stop_codon:yes gene_type:complete
MSKIKIKQTKSPIGRNANQRQILISLGLNKINRERVLVDNPAVQGMIDKVKHLIIVEQVK